ncbi:glycosyltransferase [Planctomicrobium piriforme]|uniref:Glycosyl transferases group 1 n=1 Tax=Planctomicrobium piriforme TaxID=1576369 RepID=A0A1I3P2B5_9PLAN|nr:glycosyltransferase [Planctomicrobium piriforme]SFJ15688.1 Glycosyl transferases group 1 [Planctomicrobium piriforme]
MLDAICVIGHPSRLGGADTELDHQIHCWQAMGLEVHVCPTFPLDTNQRSMRLEERGCIYHAARDWASLEGLHCISFCNGEYLKALREISQHARSTSFVNCMSWNFDMEIEAQEKGWLDFHLYQTRHSFEKVSQKLQNRGIYRPLFFQPYFHADEFPFIDDRPQDKFRFGRISRDDPDKFGRQQLWIYETMTAPVLKEGLILGWGPKVEQKFGRRPHDYIQALPAGGLGQRAFYAQCEAIIMTTDTFENLPRVGFEAMASGSILVVDDRAGWKLEVDDGVTGWLCQDDREFVYKASRCAFEHAERQEMRLAARRKLEANWGMQVAMDSWAQVFEEWELLDTKVGANPELVAT